MFAKQRVMEAGLPGHVVHMYLDQSTDRSTQRMKNIVRNALRSPQTAIPSTSTAIAILTVTSPIVINVPTRGSLAVETKDSFVLWLAKFKYQKNCL